ncbi:hypothetical protein ILYODFUR_022896 [Ilyodon furcidens]|uniref:Uncharacterized protein n=1 Tax=Ilyodon furcidens TaxID=33524 RepID=A0ABV0V627_9TELE
MSLSWPGNVWGEGSLAAPTTQSRMKRKTTSTSASASTKQKYNCPCYNSCHHCLQLQFMDINFFYMNENSFKLYSLVLDFTQLYPSASVITRFEAGRNFQTASSVLSAATSLNTKLISLISAEYQTECVLQRFALLEEWIALCS